MLIIKVCVGSACHLKGSYDVIKVLQELITQNKMDNKVELKGAFCLGNCREGVSVKVDHEETVYSVNKTNVEEFFKGQVLGRI